MRKETEEHIKKFQQDHEVSLETHNLGSYWIITARTLRNQQSLHSLHYARKFITSRNEEGRVLVVTNPRLSDSYAVENWGEMASFENFFEKAIARILTDKIGMDQHESEESGVGCA